MLSANFFFLTLAFTKSKEKNNEDAATSGPNYMTVVNYQMTDLYQAFISGKSKLVKL